MKHLSLLFLVLAVTACTESTETVSQVESVARPVKVVVVAMFEIGDDTGDRPGEFQLWKERREFTEILPFHGYRDLHYNADSGLLVMVTGK